MTQFWIYFIFFGVNIPIGHYISAQKCFYLSRKDIYFLQNFISLCIISRQNWQNPPCWDTIKFSLMCNLHDLYTFLYSIIKISNLKVPERTQSEISKVSESPRLSESPHLMVVWPNWNWNFAIQSSVPECRWNLIWS